jgi:RNA polymerase sigma-70 factor (ECF subfamily)
MPSQIALLTTRMRNGDAAAADELMRLVYPELQLIARVFMRGQRPSHTLQPTALINEAFIKLFESDGPSLTDRAHLLALMSRMMRQVLVDHAREQRAAKRGGNDRRVPLDTNIAVSGARGRIEALDVLELHMAVEALSEENPSMARLVELHYFGGMTAEEAAVVVGRSAHAVRHDLRLARAWLRRKLT